MVDQVNDGHGVQCNMNSDLVSCNSEKTNCSFLTDTSLSNTNRRKHHSMYQNEATKFHYINNMYVQPLVQVSLIYPSHLSCQAVPKNTRPIQFLLCLVWFSKLFPITVQDFIMYTVVACPICPGGPIFPGAPWNVKKEKVLVKSNNVKLASIVKNLLPWTSLTLKNLQSVPVAPSDLWPLQFLCCHLVQTV